MIKIFIKSQPFADKTAIISDGKSYSFNELHQAAEQFAFTLLAGQQDLKEGRVAFMVQPGFDYVRVQWGIWQAGGIVVPLCLSYPIPSLRYTIENSGANILVVSPEFEDLMNDLATELGCRFIVLGKNEGGKTQDLPEIDDSRGAMILYTSGTTNLPKGVVSTHANLNAQISALIEAWKWTSADSTVCVLPLHHVHGVVNVVSCSLWAGASCEFMPNFSEKGIFDLITEARINVFMAVPTIYFKLINYWEAQPEDVQGELTNALAKLRLMISGSAALPVSVMERWQTISTHLLLERYGMTEIGMALSNPYDGPRVAGHVGYPLPGVSVRLSEEGEIQVKGANVFKEYWQKPKATSESFTEDGWFQTGDIAALDELGGYRILGRNSVDIIKSGGYKISALEIEEVLRQYPGIKDCSVVGLPNDEWGELVAAAIVTQGLVDEKDLNTWMREQMPAYKTPRKYLVVSELPRNTMGKVTKKDVVNLIQ
ncbi:acyl-CoA synthetase [Aquirufa sp.]|jgi:malonyl-CoA/methylmalonyl-CoA synthetase|uniref:acyl-CoA synthetase n=1 Tax=Aquirufa sp. TaxID=2676249 RepID=UPI0037BE6B45